MGRGEPAAVAAAAASSGENGTLTWKQKAPTEEHQGSVRRDERKVGSRVAVDSNGHVDGGVPAARGGRFHARHLQRGRIALLVGIVLKEPEDGRPKSAHLGRSLRSAAGLAKAALARLARQGPHPVGAGPVQGEDAAVAFAVRCRPSAHHRAAFRSPSPRSDRRRPGSGCCAGPARAASPSSTGPTGFRDRCSTDPSRNRQSRFLRRRASSSRVTMPMVTATHQQQPSPTSCPLRADKGERSRPRSLLIFVSLAWRLGKV